MPEGVLPVGWVTHANVIKFFRPPASFHRVISRAFFACVAFRSRLRMHATKSMTSARVPMFHLDSAVFRVATARTLSRNSVRCQQSCKTGATAVEYNPSSATYRCRRRQKNIPTRWTKTLYTGGQSKTYTLRQGSCRVTSPEGLWSARSASPPPASTPRAFLVDLNTGMSSSSTTRAVRIELGFDRPHAATAWPRKT